MDWTEQDTEEFEAQRRLALAACSPKASFDSVLKWHYRQHVTRADRYLFSTRQPMDILLRAYRQSPLLRLIERELPGAQGLPARTTPAPEHVFEQHRRECRALAWWLMWRECDRAGLP